MFISELIFNSIDEYKLRKSFISPTSFVRRLYRLEIPSSFVLLSVTKPHEFLNRNRPVDLFAVTYIVIDLRRDLSGASADGE